ncbi:MAG: helix-turn-helix domain-containing protein [Candidatus Omnitrophota bacterium]
MAKRKEILTIKDVAEFLDIHPMTVYKYVKGGKLPAFKIGTSWRVRKDSIKKWIEENEQKQNGGEHV